MGYGGTNSAAHIARFVQFGRDHEFCTTNYFLHLDEFRAPLASSWLERLQLDIPDPAGIISREIAENAMDMIEILAWHKEFKKKERAEIEAAVRTQMMQEHEAALDAQKREREHLFERRLGRPLTPQERTTLLARVQELGAEKVGDIFVDSSKDELAAWLATP